MSAGSGCCITATRARSTTAQPRVEMNAGFRICGFPGLITPQGTDRGEAGECVQQRCVVRIDSAKCNRPATAHCPRSGSRERARAMCAPDGFASRTAVTKTRRLQGATAPTSNDRSECADVVTEAGKSCAPVGASPARASGKWKPSAPTRDTSSGLPRPRHQVRAFARFSAARRRSAPVRRDLLFARRPCCRAGRARAAASGSGELVIGHQDKRRQRASRARLPGSRPPRGARGSPIAR